MVSHMEDSFKSDVFGVEKEMVKLRVFWQQFIRVCLVEMYIRH